VFSNKPDIISADGVGKEKKRRKPRGGTGADDQPDPIRDPVMRNVAAQQQQQLRVHIKAQPGTAVHITPSATPPTREQGAPAAYHHLGRPAQPLYQAPPHGARVFSSGAESETEI